MTSLVVVALVSRYQCNTDWRMTMRLEPTWRSRFVTSSSACLVVLSSLVSAWIVWVAWSRLHSWSSLARLALCCRCWIDISCCVRTSSSRLTSDTRRLISCSCSAALAWHRTRRHSSTLFVHKHGLLHLAIILCRFRICESRVYASFLHWFLVSVNSYALSVIKRTSYVKKHKCANSPRCYVRSNQQLN